MSDFKLVPVNLLHAEAMRSDKSVLLLTAGAPDPADMAEMNAAINDVIASNPTETGFALGGVVLVTGDQTIAGAKAFTSDIESSTAGNGVILKAPGGTRWKLTVSDAGAPVFTQLF